MEMIDEEKPRFADRLVQYRSPHDRQATLGVPQNPDKKPSTTIAPTSPRPLYKKDGFLAGEDTPVWFANLHRATEYRFERRDFTLVRPYGRPAMVKKAINYWNALKVRGGFPIRKKRSIYDHGNLTYIDQFHDALSNVGINHFDSPSLVEKRSTDSIEVVYPSILVVMDYTESRSVEEHVLYALAYWGTVASSLRHIQNPRVSLRIAGIVITKSRYALTYLMYNQGERTFVRALQPMMDYWKSELKRRDGTFQTGSYDIVVHMTDIFPWSNYLELVPYKRQNNPILGVATAGPPCKLAGQIGGIIIYDTFRFDALYMAIALMSKVLGGGDQGPVDYTGYQRNWKKEALDTLSNALKDASCMSAPKEHYRPGTPIAPILAGDLMPSGKQCELAGYKSDAWTCWDTEIDARRSTCKQLQCSNDHIWGVTCGTVGLPLDGTFCNAENTKICLDGVCVDKK